MATRDPVEPSAAELAAAEETLAWLRLRVLEPVEACLRAVTVAQAAGQATAEAQAALRKLDRAIEAAQERLGGLLQAETDAETRLVALRAVHAAETEQQGVRLAVAQAQLEQLEADADATEQAVQEAHETEREVRLRAQTIETEADRAREAAEALVAEARAELAEVQLSRDHVVAEHDRLVTRLHRLREEEAAFMERVRAVVPRE